jgi:hypothetical protein
VAAGGAATGVAPGSAAPPRVSSTAEIPATSATSTSPAATSGPGRRRSVEGVAGCGRGSAATVAGAGAGSATGGSVTVPAASGTGTECPSATVANASRAWVAVGRSAGSGLSSHISTEVSEPARAGGCTSPVATLCSRA